MRTFADWLWYYNDLDVVPGLEALQKMRAFYTEKGIDILKDAGSLPSVIMHYLLRGTLERGAELYSPCKEAYNIVTLPHSRRDHDPPASFQKPETLSADNRLRRQRTVPIDNAA